jgi:hypothetical protein
MIVSELIEELKLEDPTRVIRNATIVYEDRDRFINRMDRTSQSKAVKEKKDKLKDKI